MIFPSLNNQNTTVQREGNFIVAQDDLGELKTRIHEAEGRVQISSESTSNDLFLRTIEFIFGQNPALKEIEIEGHKQITREEFFQTTNLWHIPKNEKLLPEKWNRSFERPHPIRSDRKDGVFYKRFAQNINKTITIRGIDPEKDLDTFHNWHNQPRVAFFWELAQTKEELKAYMEKTKSDPHMIPTFVELDGKPVAYFELYWTLEDRLGPYYPADAFDRGFHFLVGEKDALGFENTDSIVKSVLHCLFLDDPRTRRVMAEPRADNKKVLKYVESSGWKKLYEFDFPHKRAALLECKRENFFNGERL